MEYLRVKASSSMNLQIQTGVSHALYRRSTEGNNANGVDKLEQICARFPELKIMIGQYLTGNNMAKLTPTDKTLNNGEKHGQARETFYKDLIENNDEYSIVPKAILRDYKIVPDKLLDIITQAKDQVNIELKEKQEYLIEVYESRIKKLEEEKEDLRRQIPPKQ